MIYTNYKIIYKKTEHLPTSCHAVMKVGLLLVGKVRLLRIYIVKQPQTMMAHPPYFTVGIRFWCWCDEPFFSTHSAVCSFQTRDARDFCKPLANTLEFFFTSLSILRCALATIFTRWPRLGRVVTVLNFLHL